MRNHNGMRPQDIVVMLKIISAGNVSESVKGGLTNKFLAESLKLSPAEVTHSIKRSAYAGLLTGEKEVNKQALLDFLKYGIKYVFPDRPGKIIRGIATAHSAKPLSDQIVSEDNYVWASISGKIKGQELVPLYDKVPEVVNDDEFLYKALALIDAIRVGKNREYILANQELEKMIMTDD